MRKKLLRLARLAPLALLFASVASAQTTGTILGVVTDASTGKPVAGAVIVATSPALQGEQTAVTDNNGNFRFTLLPSGAYRLAVQLEGYKSTERSDVTLRPDKTIRANLAVVPEAVQMEEQVVRTGAAPAVNVGSAEAGAVVSKEFMSSIPVGRGFDAIAVVAPTAKLDATGVGFAGAQGAENQYIVDGFNTTDPAYGTRGGNGGFNAPPSLRSNFLQEIDVKTSGFNAEYGRATGGIMNVILKSGSNEFHGSVFSTFTPSMLVEPTGKTTGGLGEALAYRAKPDEGSYGLDFGFEVGGPIMKDKLWFYAGFSPVTSRTMYQRFARQNATELNSGGTCPAGTTPDGGHGECVDALLNPIQTTIPGTERNLRTSRTTYQWVGKLTYLLDENNNFTVTGWGAPSSRTSLNAGGPFYGASPAAAARSRELLPLDENQLSVLGRYGGKFLDKKLITEVSGGVYHSKTSPQDKTVGGVDQFKTAEVEWGGTELNLTDFEALPAGAVAQGFCSNPADTAACPLDAYTTGGRGTVFDSTSDRFNGRASAAYLAELAGQHTLKGGVDLERVQYKVDGYHSGGAIWYFAPATSTLPDRFYAYRSFGTIVNPGGGPLPTNASTGFPGLELSAIQAAAAAGTPVVTRTTQTNKSETDSFAYFLQDSWQPGFFPNLTLNAGLRLETQSMKNLSVKNGSSFDITDNWAPRVQAIWDFTGNGRGKLAGAWGRYYYAMPLDMGNRSFGAEVQLQYFLNASSCGFAGNFGSFDPKSLDFPSALGNGFNSTSCAIQPRSGGNNDVRLYGGATPIDPKLKGSYNDQFGAQAEYEILPDLAVGVDYQGRRQGAVIEDMSSNDGGTFFISNPGERSGDITVNGVVVGNATNVQTYDPMTNKTVTTKFPKPERSYDGVTFKATKQFSNSWLAQASYTYSSLRGNYSGPYYPEYGQLDPGITAAYDLASLMANTTGYLPGDTTHQVKLFGAYTYSFSPRLSATASGAYNGISGTPVSAMGAHPEYGSSSAFIIPRGQAGRTPFVNTVDVGAGIGYTVKPPYALNFRVDVFNVFNAQETLEYDQDYTFDTVTPMNGLNCDSKNSIGKSDPIGAIQKDCPGLAYLKSVDGRPVTVNPNFGRPSRATTAYQLPISLRLGVALSF
ncbi:TonB-dependent receptor [Anaeromyxobacter sp. SG64]|uniref:TonB-dependent receptor n=1 Tax=Anaeromyxobacter sp. SG64 TaxID=2925409 RepID=UPI001F55E790|nr:TonB-dependent receptor [Anaeromyxobacter sp. SG64]